MSLIIQDGDVVRSLTAFVRRTMEGSTTLLGYCTDPSFYSADFSHPQDQSLARIVASLLPVAVGVDWRNPMHCTPPILKRGIFLSQEAATRCVDLLPAGTYVPMSAGQELDCFVANFRHAHNLRVAGTLLDTQEFAIVPEVRYQRTTITAEDPAALSPRDYFYVSGRPVYGAAGPELRNCRSQMPRSAGLDGGGADIFVAVWRVHRGAPQPCRSRVLVGQFLVCLRTPEALEHHRVLGENRYAFVRAPVVRSLGMQTEGKRRRDSDGDYHDENDSSPRTPARRHLGGRRFSY